MATQTTGNLKLLKPDGTDKVKEFRAPYNSNLDKIDEAVSAQSQQIDELGDTVAAIESGIAIIIDGDTATQAVTTGGYAYIKNNTHGLSEGMYKNTSSTTFPARGGTADNTIFEPVSTGAVNDLASTLKIGSGSSVTLPFTAPSDGFIAMYINPSTVNGAYARLVVTNAPYITAEAKTGEPAVSYAPIRKNAYVTQAVLTGGSLACFFIPIFQN